MARVAAATETVSQKVDLQVLGSCSCYLSLYRTLLNIPAPVRLVLATANALALCLLRRAVSRRFGRLVSWLFVAFTISQFHMPFWMGRTLPNMFALFPGALIPLLESYEGV